MVQEQHPDRARLYLQWRKFDVPVFVDSLNLLPHRVVPVPIALDENGVVRLNRLKQEQIEEFVRNSFPDLRVPDGYNVVQPTDLSTLKRKARQSDRAADWRNLGDAYFVRERNRHMNKSVHAYREAIERQPDHGPTHFRLGVALQRRYETEHRREGDGQQAVSHWENALSLNPNQYIWRRRLQQYGPRLDKPYNFYFWIRKARKAIEERGEQPVSLSVEPRGSEVQSPDSEGQARNSTSVPNPDPEGRILSDSNGLVSVSTVTTPQRVRPGEDVRVRVHFRLRSENRPYWNNEAEPLTLSPNLPDSLSLNEGSFRYPNAQEPETRGDRVLEFEVSVPPDLEKSTVTLPMYALYNVCEEKQGVCRYLRKDFSARIMVDPDAPSLK